MLTDAMGLILADNHFVQLGALNQPRALAAVPFAGRFRIIDFTLSNMVNCGVKAHRCRRAHALQVSHGPCGHRLLVGS